MLDHEVYDRLFVDLFNQILKREQSSLKTGEFRDLSVNELHTLDAINRTPDKKMRDIADKLDITLSTLTTAVNNLIKKGYVVTKRSLQDKRIVNVTLTNKAKEALNAHEEFHINMIESALKNLSEDERCVLEKALDKLCDYFTNIK